LFRTKPANCPSKPNINANTFRTAIYPPNWFTSFNQAWASYSTRIPFLMGYLENHTMCYANLGKEKRQCDQELIQGLTSDCNARTVDVPGPPHYGSNFDGLTPRERCYAGVAELRVGGLDVSTLQLVVNATSAVYDSTWLTWVSRYLGAFDYLGRWSTDKHEAVQKALQCKIWWDTAEADGCTAP